MGKVFNSLMKVVISIKQIFNIPNYQQSFHDMGYE